MDDRKADDDEAAETRRNRAPDAVKDPNEKTEGKPGKPAPQDGGEDPGAG